MTLVDIFLRVAECKTPAELITAPPRVRSRLADTLKKITADRVPLDQWNTLLVSFGGAPCETKIEAYDTLLLLLSETCIEKPDTAEQDTAETEEPSVEPEHSSEEPDMVEEKTEQKPPNRKKVMFLKIWNIFTTVLVVMAVVLAVTLAGVRVFGLQVFSVLSGSMEPEYHVGSLIYVKTVDYTELAVGDDITFMLDEETVATHRIVEILPDVNDPTVLRFRTQGIANDEVDGTPVHYKNVIGKPVFTIPKLGYIASYIQNPPGTYVAISIGAIILFLVFLPDLLTSEDEPKKEKEKKEKPKKQKPTKDNTAG